MTEAAYHAKVFPLTIMEQFCVMVKGMRKISACPGEQNQSSTDSESPLNSQSSGFYCLGK